MLQDSISTYNGAGSYGKRQRKYFIGKKEKDVEYLVGNKKEKEVEYLVGNEKERLSILLE